MKEAAQAEMFHNRLAKRFRHLKKWARRTGVEVFRLYDRDIPEIPLVLDLYGDAVSGALYKRPYETDEGEEAAWLDAMTEAASGALGISREQIFLKMRERQRGAAQYGKLAGPGFLRDVREGGLVFRVNLSSYLDTGLFPDRRKLRSRIREEAAGKLALNLFCYTASFSVYAAAGSAAQIDSVDLSKTYLDWAGENFKLNNLFNPAWRFIRSDVMDFLKAAKAAGRSWDLIICDPPAFSNSKAMRGTFDLKRDHGALLRLCLDTLRPGGRLYFSVNTKGFKLETPEGMKDITEEMRDEDFREKRIPLCYVMQKGA